MPTLSYPTVLKSYKFIGPMASIVILCLPLPLTTPALQTLAITIWMVCWWLDNEIPIGVTSLLPLVLFPILGILDSKTLSISFAHRSVYLYLGSAAIAIAMQKHNLHLFLATKICYRYALDFKSLILSLMVTTSFLSMWMSNTIIAIMMLPVANAMLDKLKLEHKDAQIITALAIAFSASIGGCATLIGTGTNVVIAGILRQQLSLEIGFFTWICYALPLTLVMLYICWQWLIRNTKHLDKALLNKNNSFDDQRQLSSTQIRIIIVAGALIFGWLLEPLLNYQHTFFVDDTDIVLIAAISLFIIPESKGQSRPLLSWDDLHLLPWHILLLLGAGFSLAHGFEQSGLIAFILQFFPKEAIATHQYFYFIALIGLTAILTELMSNVAIAALLTPIALRLSDHLGLEPQFIALIIAFCASYAFVLPIATPANAVVMSNRSIRAVDMIHKGLGLTVIAVFISALYVLLLSKLFT